MLLARRVLAFAGLPFLSLLTPFLFLPILARIAGADAWLAIAVGQSAGGFAALFVSLGYPTVGPTVVALAAEPDRPEVLRRSIRPRLAVFVPAAVIAGLIAALVAPSGYRLEAVLMSLALALSGLSSTWYMVGLGKAGLIVAYEIAPRIVATAIAAALLLGLGQVIWYPALLLAAAVIGSLVFLLHAVGGRELARGEPGQLRAVIRENRTALATEASAGAYNSLSVTLVSIAASVPAAAAFVSGDKLYRIGQYSVSALGNALQGWVVEDDRTQFSRRARTSLLLHLALGLAGLAAFVLLGPWLSGVLFGAVVAIDLATAAGFGVAAVGIALGTGLGRVVLVALDARRAYMLSVIAGAVVGIPAVIGLAWQFGAAGGAWGLALGEAVSVICQAVVAARRWPRARGRPPTSINSDTIK